MQCKDVRVYVVIIIEDRIIQSDDGLVTFLLGTFEYLPPITIKFKVPHEHSVNFQDCSQ